MDGWVWINNLSSGDHGLIELKEKFVGEELRTAEIDAEEIENAQMNYRETTTSKAG